MAMRITPPMVMLGISLLGLGLVYRGCSHADAVSKVALTRSIFAITHSRGAEAEFMQACKECASASECERDRLVIASGLSTDNYNPCE